MIDETLEGLIEEAIQDEVASTELVLSSPLPDNLILYPLDTAVVFPGMFFPLEIPAVGDARTVMDQMLDGNRMIGFVTIRADRPQENHREQAEPQELHRIGVAARIAKVFRMPDDSLRVLCQTLCRFRIERFRRADDILVAKVSYPPDIDPIDEKRTRSLAAAFAARSAGTDSNRPTFPRKRRSSWPPWGAVRWPILSAIPNTGFRAATSPRSI